MPSISDCMLFFSLSAAAAASFILLFGILALGVCVFIHNNNTPDLKPKYLANGMGGDNSPTFQTTRAYIYMQEHMGKNIERERKKKYRTAKKGVKQTRTHEMILYSELSG